MANGITPSSPNMHNHFIRGRPLSIQAVQLAHQNQLQEELTDDRPGDFLDNTLRHGG
jgi:hypothetical protein